MQRDKAFLLIIVAFLAGFIIGAISGIKFYGAQKGGGSSPTVSGEAPASPQAKANAVQEIGQLEEALKHDPENLQILISLGNAYFDTNQERKAIDVYAKALKFDPKNADVRTDMGIMYRNIKDYDNAVKEFRQAAATTSVSRSPMRTAMSLVSSPTPLTLPTSFSRSRTSFSVLLKGA
jgi:tetratricopeptide (TPR) repeat protein